MAAMALLLLLAPGLMGEPLVSSGPGMARVAALERELVGEVKRHAGQLEAALASIEEYTAQVSAVYGRACPGGQCSEQAVEEHVLGNPIHNYQLLKRVTVYWANVEKAISKVDREAVLAAIRKIKKRSGALPTEDDLAGAARTLNRLAEVYSVPARELVAGRLQGRSTGAALGLHDTYFLARTAANQQQAGLAAGLVEEALAMAANHPNSSMAQVGAMRQMLQQQRARAGEGREAGPGGYRLGIVPPRTSDGRKLTTDQDKTNFHALCRGERLLSATEEAALACRHLTRGDPYLRLQPFPVEVLHRAPHEVLLFHSVLGPAQCRGLASIAENKLKQAAIGQTKELSEIRVSRNAWLEDGVAPLVDGINRQADLLTGLQGSFTGAGVPRARREEFEFLQIAEYGIGGHYNLHQDPMFVYKDSTFLAESVEASVPYLTGDRMSTLMFYLSDVEAGGVTAFPRLGVAAAPRLGSAIFWHNINRSGASDMAMLHGGCPVLLGSKLVANKWMREVAQAFHRPCGLRLHS